VSERAAVVVMEGLIEMMGFSWGNRRIGWECSFGERGRRTKGLRTKKSRG